MFKKWISHISKHWKTYLLLAVLLVISVFNVTPAIKSVFETISISGTSKRKMPVCSVATPEKRVAISFDATAGADDTDDLLSTLRQYDVKATFFLCGYWVERYPDEVKKIYEDGNDIGNLGNSNAHGAQLSLAQNKEEIMKVHKKIRKLLGIDMDLFRAPYGDYNNTVILAAQDCGYYTIQWNVDSLDWMNISADDEVNRVLNNKDLKNGSIILLHNDAKYTPAALPIILRGLKAKGFTIGSVSELIYKENYKIDGEGRQIPDRISK